MRYESLVTYFIYYCVSMLASEFCRLRRLSDSVKLDLCAGLWMTASMLYSCLDVLHW